MNTTRSHSVWLGTLACAVLAVPAAAETYIVDPSGGGDFTNLPDAIAAVVDGDVLLVEDGNYAGFVLDKGLVVLALGRGASIGSDITVRDIAAGSTAVLAGFHCWLGVDVLDCTGPVVLDEIRSRATVFVQSSADVRILRSHLECLDAYYDGCFALVVESARVEIGSSTCLGEPGDDYSLGDGGWGGDGVVVRGAGASAHVYRSDLIGGDGGDGDGWSLGNGGNGGDALRLESGTQALVAGTPAQTLVGGAGGSGYLPGTPGVGIRASEAAVRFSGVDVVGTDFVSTYVETPVPPDPSLTILTTPKRGQIETFRVAAEPGSTVRLLMGRNATVTPYGNLEEDLLVQQQRVFQLGIVDASGVIGFNFPISAALPQGFTFFAQAKVTLPSGELRYTNSVPLIVR